MSTITSKKEVEFDHLIWTDSERMSGAPCFYGTRVPVKNLFDYLEGVSREQADAVLRSAMESLLEQLKQS